MRAWTPVLLAAFWVWSDALADDWIDPTDMRRFSGSLKREGPAVEPKQPTNQLQQSCSAEAAACPHYLLRFLNLLLKGSHLESVALADESVQEVWLKMEVRGRDLRLLKEFGSGSRPLDLRHINDIISEVLSPESLPPPQLELPSTLDVKSYITPLSFFVFLVCSLIFLFFYHVYSGYSFSSAACLLYVVIFLVVFGWESFRLYNEKVAQQKAELMKTETGIPVECTPSRMSMWNSFMNLFRREDRCEEYFRKIDPDPLSSTDIGQAFSNTFKVMVYSIVAGIGTVISEILSAISDKLLWPLNWIVYILLVGFIILYVFFRSILSFTKVKFSSLLWSFEVHRGHGAEPEKQAIPSTSSSQPPNQNTSVPSITSSDEPDKGLARTGGGDGVHFFMSPELFRTFCMFPGGGDAKPVRQQVPTPAVKEVGGEKSAVVKASDPKEPEETSSSSSRPGGLSKKKKDLDMKGGPVFLRRIGRQTSF